MRLLSFLAGLTGLLWAGAIAAQTPPGQPGVPPPPPPLEAENAWHLDLSTGGRVSIQLRPDVAPGHVERIKTLTRRGFYDGLIFHRVIDGFMAQGGDPTGTGSSGSELPDLPAEIRGLPHVRGAVGMARAQDLNSANSQFYIMFVPRLTMDRNYTVFGRVVGGMNFIDAIERGEPPSNLTLIVRASIGSDNVPALSAEQLRAAGARRAQAQVQAAPLISAPLPTTTTASQGALSSPSPAALASPPADEAAAPTPPQTEPGASQAEAAAPPELASPSEGESEAAATPAETGGTPPPQ